MTKAQNTLYWREWNAAKKAAHLEEPDRHQLHLEALGEDKSSKDFTNEDLDKVLATFRALSQPAALRPQLRAQEQPNTRKLHKIAALLKCLGLFVADPVQYMAKLLHDRFHVELLEDLARADLSAHCSSLEIRNQKSEIRNLDHLIYTLTARVSFHRRKAILIVDTRREPGPLTEHDMCRLARVPCFRPNCAKCRDQEYMRTRNAEVSRDAHLATTEQPF